MQTERKQRNVSQANFVLNGGLNYAQSAANIADNELKRAINFIYDPATDFLVTRAGTSCATASALSDPILALYYYQKNTSTAYLVCASGGKLYYLNSTAWVEIGSLTDSTTVPSFLTFNDKLIIADGGSSLRIWDGSTYTTIANSPPATALDIIKNRVVANATDEPDSIYFSAPNDCEGADAWDTTKNAVGLKAGYGDNLSVNAFAVFKDDLIVSKKGVDSKKIYRVNVAAADTSNWYVQELSGNNAAQNSQTMINAWNNVFFVDNNGFKSLKGVTEYGDLQVDAVGRKINTLFTQNYACDSIKYLPTYNAIWFNIGNRIFCYTERYDPNTGQLIPAFTDIVFNWGRCMAMCEADDIVYLAAYNGYLYKLDESLATDETAPSVTSNYLASVRTKTLSFFMDGILKKTEWYLRPKATGTANIYVCYAENNKTLLGQVTLQQEGKYLYDATEDVYDAESYLYDTGTSSWVDSKRGRYRGIEMAFEIEVTSGRTGVEWCKAEIATLEGGE